MDPFSLAAIAAPFLANRPEAALALETIARAYGEDLRPGPLEAARRGRLAGAQ